jgi:CRP-like cAMP-binding protein
MRETDLTTDNSLELTIRKLGRRVALSEEDRQALLALRFTRRTVEPSSYLVREGDEPRQCAVLLTGFAFRQKITGEGARQIIALHIPGDILDLQNLYLDVSDHNVQSLTRSDVAFFNRSDLQEIASQRPSVGHAFFMDTLIDASIFREWVTNVGRRDSRARLAHLLCEFALRLEASGLAEQYRYELPMTQEQLADALGLTAVHVNRTLKTLDAAGLIVREKRNLRIPDWKRMREAGDFSDRYLHLHQRDGGGGGLSKTSKSDLD